MTERHEPRKEFVERLEWRVMNEFSREGFQPVEAGWRKWIRRTILVGASILAGAAVTTAAQRYQDQERQRLIQAEAEAAVELTSARLELANGFLESLEVEASADPELRETLLYSQFERALIESEVLNAKSRLEEVRLTGREPREELTAPLVGGRDFVSERLGNELRGQNVRLETVRSEVQLNEPGTDDMERVYMDRYLAELDARTRELEEQMRLRREFLAGRMTARQVTQARERVAAEERLRLTEEAAAVAQQEVDRFQQAVENGRASFLDLRQVEFEAKAREIEARLARLRLEYLENQLRQ